MQAMKTLRRFALLSADHHHDASFHCRLLGGGSAMRPTRKHGLTAAPAGEKIRVILDTDANNELDDQHAIAYLLFNGQVFDVEGITVNRTRNGGDIQAQYAEALRVVQLCNLHPEIRSFAGPTVRLTRSRVSSDGRTSTAPRP
jgi:hypothetical protein